MNEKVTVGSNETRLQVAKDSITSFIEEHIIQKLQSGEGLEDINLSLVQFGSGATLKLDVTIADNGNTLMVGDTPYTDVNDFHNAIHAVIDGITAPQNSATNYQYGFQVVREPSRRGRQEHHLLPVRRRADGVRRPNNGSSGVDR